MTKGLIFSYFVPSGKDANGYEGLLSKSQSDTRGQPDAGKAGNWIAKTKLQVVFVLIR